jgi:hypothetical protein
MYGGFFSCILYFEQRQGEYQKFRPSEQNKFSVVYIESWVKYGQDYWLVIEPRLAPKYLRKIHGIKYSSPPPHLAPFFLDIVIKNLRESEFLQLS